MRALLSEAIGGPDSLRLGECPTPVPGPGEIRIAVRACAINFPDTLIIEDLYQIKPQRPFAPGSEVAGVVDAVGEGVLEFVPGDRVIALTIFGGLAEQVVATVDNTFALPPECGFVEGSALLFTHGTTIHALCDRAALRPGETLLVLGAAGGTGIAAIELGKALGARIVAAVSSAEKADFARAAGADAVIVYDRAPFDRQASRALADAFKAAVGPNGADVIYDPVGGDYAEPALRAIAWQGRYLVIGFPAGIPKLPLNLVLLKSCDVRGVVWGAFAAREPAANRANVARLFALWKDGSIVPRITATYPLTRAGEAIAALAERRAIGKLVVTIGD